MTSPRHNDPPAPFGLVEEQIEPGGVVVLAVSGELDLFTAPELRDRLRAHVERAGEASDLVVDLSGCAFVDASGCQALLRAARQLDTLGRRLAIVNTNPANTRILTVMGLDELFPIERSRDAAAAALRHART